MVRVISPPTSQLLTQMQLFQLPLYNSPPTSYRITIPNSSSRLSNEILGFKAKPKLLGSSTIIFTFGGCAFYWRGVFLDKVFIVGGRFRYIHLDKGTILGGRVLCKRCVFLYKDTILGGRFHFMKKYLLARHLTKRHPTKGIS